MSINESEVFIEGERTLGRYPVEMLIRTDHGWVPAVMPLEALVSNFRLFLKPFRRKFTHASIPAHYIVRILNVEMEKYHSIAIVLRTGHRIHLITNPRYFDDIIMHLQTMALPAPKFQFDEKVAREDIQRLITYFGRWASKDEEA